MHPISASIYDYLKFKKSLRFYLQTYVVNKHRYNHYTCILHIFMSAQCTFMSHQIHFYHQSLYDSCITSKTTCNALPAIDAQWDGMGDAGSERYKPALLPPCPTIRVSSYSS